MDNSHVISIIEHTAEEHRTHMEKCRQAIEDYDFSQPVPVTVAVSCDGRLSFYMESDSADEREFIDRALDQCVGLHVHLLGYFRATITMGEFVRLTRDDHDAAIARFYDAKYAEVEEIMAELDQRLEAIGE